MCSLHASPPAVVARLAGALVALAPLAAHAQTTRIDTTVAVGREGVAVDLSLVSGPVTVTAWERGDVQVRAVSERLPLRFEHAGRTVRVWVPTGESRGRGGDQRLEVVVPVGARVVARSVSGDVRVRDVRGELEATSVSGDVEARGAERRIVVESVSGDVAAGALRGDMRARSVSGDVRIGDVAGEIDAESVSGDVVLRDARAPRVRARTVSGDVSYDGTLARDGRYEFGSHSGDVRLALPADVAASLTARTFSGSIDSDFAMTVQGTPRGDDDAPRARRRRDREMEFTIGGGGARIVVESFSGDVAVTRRAP